ncbi:Wall-associated receptor kinase, galacturonan-binding domain containing protein [Parasponia andersonii]|uniref:RING-type E3 ubiquitin transferase n=1 Tax=Parasponia andersonii TaxID=3476 RepID=A0A2P5DFN7_PARAD|nr:Wall-associated receptor kinase, galacturonan-binding domain containing protein [Parasponia andersonii]
MSWFCMLLLLLIVFLVEVGAECGHKGPSIRFPFGLKHDQNHIAYHGFELSCNDTHIVLELPIPSIKFFVTDIDYKAQVIKVYDPDNCLLGKLLKIRNLLSTSPFRFAQDNVSNYTLFNCSRERGETSLYYQSIPCLSGPGYQIYVAQPYSAIDELPIDCTKLNNTSPLPYEGYDIYNTKYDHNLRLKWLEPACGHCEAKGKRCRPKNNTTMFEIDCFHFHPKGEKKKYVAVGKFSY